MAEEDIMAAMPPQGMPPQGMPPMPPQGMPPQGMPPEGMPPEESAARATEAMMAPDEEVTAIIASRLSMLTPEELEILDEAISPESAAVLTKLLPEIKVIIDMVEGSGMGQAAPPEMGALGGVV